MNITIKNENEKWIAVLEGRLDTANATIFEEGVAPLAEHAAEEIWLDCAKLEYISSSGLRQFLALRKLTSAKNGKLVVANLNSGLMDIFKMTGFTSLFDFA